MSQSTTEATSFLNKIGRPVTSVAELHVGDIVGRINPQGEVYSYGDIRLDCVERVELEPLPPFFLPPRPRAYFMRPEVGFTVLNGDVGRLFIHTPMPGQYHPTYSWAVGESLMAINESEVEWAETVNAELFPLWLINDNEYRRLGQLIPKVQVPSWGFLAQTVKGPKPIHKFVENVEANLMRAAELYEEIKNEAEAVR